MSDYSSADVSCGGLVTKQATEPYSDNSWTVLPAKGQQVSENKFKFALFQSFSVMEFTQNKAFLDNCPSFPSKMQFSFYRRLPVSD